MQKRSNRPGRVGGKFSTMTRPSASRPSWTGPPGPVTFASSASYWRSSPLGIPSPFPFCLATLGSGPTTDNGHDRPEKGTGKEWCAGRAGCPHKRRDVAGALLRATPQGRGGEAAMASLLVGHDGFPSLHSSRLALTASPPRHGRCRWRVRTLIRKRRAGESLRSYEHHVLDPHDGGRRPSERASDQACLLHLEAADPLVFAGLSGRDPARLVVPAEAAREAGRADGEAACRRSRLLRDAGSHPRRAARLRPVLQSQSLFPRSAADR